MLVILHALVTIFFVQKTCETLDMQSSTDDDLIARHLKCLAKWSVRIIVHSVIIDVVLCTEKW